jgi:diacylglycerol O-acyltransferase
MGTTDDRPGRFDEHMSASDAVLWDIEKDPVLRSTITAVAVLDREPDWDRLVRRMDLASRSIPRLRQRVVVPPLRVGPPRWVVDAQFDLAYHLRRVRAPEPATLRTVLDLAQPIAMSGFDRARPLWEFTLVEGLADGKAALIEKLHHSLADGVGAIELAMMMIDETPAGDDRGPMPPPPEPGTDAPAAVFRQALEERVTRVGGSVASAPRTVGGAAVSALRDPAGSITRAAELSRSIARLLTPVTEPASPIMRGRSLSRRFDTLEVRLADLKASGHRAGGTLNDAFLAAVIGGVARYHGMHGATLDTLRITMPVNYRGTDDSMGGNRFAPARFAVPASIADPVERMQQVGAVAHAWQAEPSLAYSDAVAGVLDRLPVSVTTSIFGGMLKNIDLVCTNVPGLPDRAYLAGAEIERQYAFAPPSGASLSVALLSHVETACVGLVVDTVAVPDHEALMACLVGGFDEVLAVSGHGVVRTA